LRSGRPHDYGEFTVHEIARATASIAKLRALPCDIFLGLHSWDFALLQKWKAGQGNAFTDPEGYKQFLDKAEAALKLQVKKESFAPASKR